MVMEWLNRALYKRKIKAELERRKFWVNEVSQAVEAGSICPRPEVLSIGRKLLCVDGVLFDQILSEVQDIVDQRDAYRDALMKLKAWKKGLSDGSNNQEG